MQSTDKNTQEVKIKTPRLSTEKLKAIILNIVNILLIIGIFYISGRLPQLSGEIKELRAKKIISQESSDIAVLSAELEKNKNKINELSSIYLDERGLSSFFAKMEDLAEKGVVSQFDSFLSEPVADRNGQLGLPILIEFAGQKESISTNLLLVQKLPYLMRPVSVELNRNTDEGGGYTFKYGVFLYVDESLKKN